MRSPATMPLGWLLMTTSQPVIRRFFASAPARPPGSVCHFHNSSKTDSYTAQTFWSMSITHHGRQKKSLLTSKIEICNFP
jgi:hypothetical protein